MELADIESGDPISSGVNENTETFEQQVESNVETESELAQTKSSQ